MDVQPQLLDRAPPVDIPQVDGLVLGNRAALAGRGEVYLARWVDEPGPDLPLRVRILRTPVSGTARERTLQLLDPYIGVEHEHLVPLVDARRWYDGVALVLAPPPVATSLVAVMERQRLSAGQVVTVGLPFVDALARLHDAGLRHGGVSVHDVLVDGDGRPLLSGAGVRAALGSAGTVQQDAAALVDLLSTASGPPGAVRLAPLQHLLERGVDDVRDLLGPLQRLATPEPLLVGAVPASPVPPRRHYRARLSRHGGLAVGALVGTLVAVAALGWASASSPTGAAPPSRAIAHVPPALEPPPHWPDVLAGLDHTRSAAFSVGSARLLDEVDARGSEARAQDGRLLAQVLSHGWRARGLALNVTAVDVRRSDQKRVVLRVTDTRAPYAFVDGGGSIARNVGGRGARSHDLALVRVESGWRIESVRDVTR